MAMLNSKRSRGCPVKSDSHIKKLGHGHIEEFIDTTKSIVVTAWFNNKQVLTVSNYPTTLEKDLLVSVLDLTKNKKKESKSSSLAQFLFTINYGWVVKADRGHPFMMSTKND